MFGRLFFSPNLTFFEKLEFLYLAPYYLQATFFLLGSFAWFASEVVFHTRLPFWTATFGWSLVLTNLLALPLMNLTGLFLEEGERKDFLGTLSFVAMTYLLVPFQAYAAVKGLFENQEGPWFRTPKTGLITDVFGRVQLQRFWKKIFPWGKAPQASSAYSLLFVNNIINNNSQNRQVLRKRLPWIGKASLVLVIITCLLFNTLVFYVQPVKAAGWLTGWGKRIKLTIDKTDVTADLLYFPVLVHLSSSAGYGPDNVTAVFTEVGASSQKIAFTKDDGTTEMYAEIENWNYTGTPSTSTAWIWVSKSDWTITTAANTDFYLYYDSTHANNTTYIGTSEGASPATNVWDSNFKLVAHMDDNPNTSTVQDSTTNGSDGTKAGAAEPAVAAIKIYNGQTFDGSNDIITAASAASLNLTANFAVDGWFQHGTASPAHKYVMVSRYVDTNNHYDIYQTYNADSSVKTCVGAFYRYGGSNYNQATATCLGTTLHHIAFVFSGGNTTTMYVDGAAVSNGGTTSSTTPGTNTGLMLGDRYSPKDNPQATYFWPGNMDEIRIQTSARSAAWWKADYETGRDHIIDFGAEEVPELVILLLPIAIIIPIFIRRILNRRKERILVLEC